MVNGIGLPGLTEQYEDWRERLGQQIDMAGANRLASDIGYSALVVIGLMYAPKIIELGINATAALYKQGAPGEFV